MGRKKRCAKKSLKKREKEYRGKKERENRK